MANFAQINDKNIVQQVLVIPNEEEHRGQDFLSNDLGLGGIWIQTSYNNRIRKNFAGIGFTYNLDLDAFIPPKPYTKWILNEETCQWEAPVPYPEDGQLYNWNNKKGTWELNEIQL